MEASSFPSLSVSHLLLLLTLTAQVIDIASGANHTIALTEKVRLSSLTRRCSFLLPFLLCVCAFLSVYLCPRLCLPLCRCVCLAIALSLSMYICV